MKTKLTALVMISVFLNACGNAPDSSEDQIEGDEVEVIKAIEDTGAPGVREQDITFTRNSPYEKNPEPEKATDTVSTVEADSKNSQRLYLWEEGNVPAQTSYTENSGNYFDEPSFRPFLTSVPVPEGIEVKGAVLLLAGGGFSLRANYTDTLPVAEELSKLGYQSFVVDYRLRPYTQEEGALDLGRAVRFVRENVEVYGIDAKDIAVMGFSAGGIQAGELLINYDGLTNGTALDSAYIPDELDEISADASAAGMIYSFYGRLSVASKDIDKLSSSNLPPTYFVYGTGDPFVDEFEANIAALEQAGVAVRYQVLQDTPHGFGAKGGWIPQYDKWLTEIFAGN
ncbi:alpha/beta hydrolase [Planomicrobium okeanokoites]|uniref:alpha/beta hydrolase n=1 Tax=Planomicrobium okeanokoites TaxID=244 RepID=UPI0024937749|nr:alpha/beta hydrolase [Planomicrobium okeanokoites]